MYGLADCDNFYASCERVFNPSLIGRPVVVLSGNDGCVIARSNEAKALGIKMGDPFFRLKDSAASHGIAVYSSNFALYGDMSNRVMNVLRSFSPATEVYSIDESFLDLSGIGPARLGELGREITRTVKRYTGIPVSLGIAPTKTLAKVASKLCKRYPKLEGCCVMHRPEDIGKVLRKYPVGDIWGIGPRYEKMLKGHGIATAWEFTQQPAEWVRKHMSVTGVRTWRELHGEACIDFETMPPPKKQIATTRSFARELFEPSDLLRNITLFASACAEKLRKQKSVCGEIRVFLHTNPFRPDMPQYYETALMKPEIPTASTLELVEYAHTLLRQIYREGYGYKRGGVILSDIRSGNGVQASLFGGRDHGRHSRLMEAMDLLNSTYGRHTVGVASQGGGPCPVNRKYLSQRFTTNWDEIIKVKAR